MLEDAEHIRVQLPGRAGEHALIDFGGDGPVALLAHATGFCAALWAPFARKLRERMRVFALDARGHGDSYATESEADYGWDEIAADLADAAPLVCERADAARIGLGVGHSFGGTTLMAAASLRPDAFERLLLVDPAIIPRDFAIRAARIESGRPDLAALASRRRGHWPSLAEAREMLGAKALFESWDPRVLDLYFSEALRIEGDGSARLKCPPAIESATFAGAPRIDWTATAPRVAAETLILHATGGNFPRANHEELAALLQWGRVEDIDTGHLVPMEQPEALADRALRFAFDETAAPARARTGQSRRAIR